MNDQPGTGALALALSKAQSQFPPIPRSREVTVQTKTGGSYKFKYATLDTILESVRKPLSDNGLAICQLIDDGALVTLLLHESGATLEGRVLLPNSPGDTVQQLGSAITYLRRYALQAALGIAAEEDDDGNASSGNRVMGDRQAQATNDGLIGNAVTGNGHSDFALRMVTTEERQTPFPRVAFRLTMGRQQQAVEALDGLAELIASNRPAIEGERVTVWGNMRPESFNGKDGKRVTYQVLTISRLKVGALDLTEPEEQHDDDFDAGWLAVAEGDTAEVGAR